VKVTDANATAGTRDKHSDGVLTMVQYVKAAVTSGRTWANVAAFTKYLNGLSGYCIRKGATKSSVQKSKTRLIAMFNKGYYQQANAS
jgi:hypothetical protein